MHDSAHDEVASNPGTKPANAGAEAGVQRADDDAAGGDDGVQRGTLRLAGMALRNGVLVIGPTHWAAAVRTREGALVTAVRLRPRASDRIDAMPALRGPVRVAEMLLVLPALRRALPQARLSFETPQVIGGTLAGSVLSRALRRRMGPVGFLPELVSGAASLALLLSLLRGGELASYHGAEHKAIGAYEQGIAAVNASKEHERCGTHLAVPLLVANAAALEGTRLLLPRNPALARLLGLGVGLAASTELARSMQRGGNSPLTRGVSRLGMALQSIASTSEPTAQQLEVAEAALAALLAVEPAARRTVAA